MKRSSSKRRAGATDDSEFKLDDFLPYRLAVTSSSVSRLFARRYAEAFDLSIPEWRVIAVVGRFGTLSPGTVGEATEMDKVKVSRAAGNLVARGLLKQTQDPTDGRGRLLSLTRKGAAVHREAIPLARDLEQSLSQGLSHAEWATLRKVLWRLNTHAHTIAGTDNGSEVD